MAGTGDSNYPPNDGQDHPDDDLTTEEALFDNPADEHFGDEDLDEDDLSNDGLGDRKSGKDSKNMFGIGEGRENAKADGELIALIDEKDAQIAELNDRFLRLAAELENARRRAEKEKSDAGKYAIAELARDLVTVADNFDRALRFLPDDVADIKPDAIPGLVTGLRMTEKELLTVLERYRIIRIFPEGERFDPNMHQAVAQVPGNGIPQGFVVDVAQPGFTIGERVLRAAMVTVSLGGGPTASPETEQSDNASTTGTDQDTNGTADDGDAGNILDTKA
ncbi:MAG: nucleotide exchange factor GrpE [Pseudomonadota bacterium]